MPWSLMGVQGLSHLFRLNLFFNTGHAKYLFTTGVVFIYQILFSLPGHMAVKLSYHSWRR